ncbi:MAG: cytochrome b [Rhodospirillales bacterium]|nr:cytochrome b [Rhodospirillales bacterium]
MYSVASRAFHWMMAGLIGLAFALVWLREDLPKGDLRTGMLSWHMDAGLLVLALVLPRVIARLLGGTPALAHMPPWQRILARAGEGGLYLMMLLQPLMGWLAVNLSGRPVSLLGFGLPALSGPDPALRSLVAELHEVGGWAILVLVGLHVAAALYHHVLCRDDVLASMLWQGLRRPDA